MEFGMLLKSGVIENGIYKKFIPETWEVISLKNILIISVVSLQF